MVAWRQWRTPLIPALGRQRQLDLCEFEASRVYKSYLQDRLQSYRKICLEEKKKERKEKKKKKIR